MWKLLGKLRFLKINKDEGQNFLVYFDRPEKYLYFCLEKKKCFEHSETKYHKYLTSFTFTQNITVTYHYFNLAPLLLNQTKLKNHDMTT